MSHSSQDGSKLGELGDEVRNHGEQCLLKISSRQLRPQKYSDIHR